MPPTDFPLTAIVTAQHTLDLPPEIKAQLIPGETYYISIQDKTITLAKNSKFDWTKWRENVNQRGEELTDKILDDICEIVSEVRRHKRVEQEDRLDCLYHTAAPPTASWCHLYGLMVEG